jgi:uncharacterized protein (DUF1778 family)
VAVAKNSKRKQLSGGAKMKAAGRKPILLGVTPEQLERLREAAALELRPVSQFVVYHAMRAADLVVAQGRRQG